MMKASVNFGKGNAVHNGRDFKPSQERDLVEIRVYENEGRRAIADGENLKEWEMERFGELFGGYIEKQNNKVTKEGHPERQTNIEKYYKSEKTGPSEIVLQVGNKDYSPNSDILTKSVSHTMKILQSKYPKFKVLDMALHKDEATPHIHARFVFQDSNGRSNKSGALREMGVLPPEPDKPISRYNNAMITFTKEFRETFEKCVEHLLKIELDKNRQSRRHLTINEYKLRQQQQELQQGSQKLHRQAQELKEVNSKVAEQKRKCEELEQALKAKEKATGITVKEVEHINQKPLFQRSLADELKRVSFLAER